MRERFCGHGAYPLPGSPDVVAQTLVRLHDAGLDGLAIALPNYLEDFPILRDESSPGWRPSSGFRSACRRRLRKCRGRTPPR